MTDDNRVQQELIPNGDENGEAKLAPLPTDVLEPETDLASTQMALEPNEVQIKFTRHPDGRITGSVPKIDWQQAYTFELVRENMTWGLFQDIEAMQQVADDKRMGTMLEFLSTYVVGGPKAVPLEHTETIFTAITLYASESMNASKN